MKVLLTGATGFIGRRLAARLVQENHEVTALVRNSSNRSGLPETTTFVEGDMLDERSLEGAVAGQDAVIHLAAYFDFYPSDEELMFETNVQGTKNLVNACLGTTVERFVYCSSTEAIGPVRFPPGTEDTELRPNYAYGESKILAETAIKETCKDTELNYIILRPTGIFGEGDFYVMFEIIKELYRERIPALPSNLESEFMFLYVDDVVEGFVAAVGSKSALNTTIILCPDEPMSWRELVELVTTHLGVASPRLRVPKAMAKAGMVLLSPLRRRDSKLGRHSFFWNPKAVDDIFAERVYTNERAKRLLGWSPRNSMQDGLAKTMDWYLENGHLKKED
ncbi:MAG: NAD-dependent epimerase/dehydratase family protein [Candidatus Thorarchaeota archaeon]|nr:NAD-dependent epimerase/dehydratase family protein [Candidatus Thorarchaeota archaeon]